MLKTIVLVCLASVDPSACTVKTAIDVVRAPSTSNGAMWRPVRPDRPRRDGDPARGRQELFQDHLRARSRTRHQSMILFIDRVIAALRQAKQPATQLPDSVQRATLVATSVRAIRAAIATTSRFPIIFGTERSS